MDTSSRRHSHPLDQNALPQHGLSPLPSDFDDQPACQVARHWRQKPARSALGRRGGFSAAIWESKIEQPREYQRSPLSDHFVLTVRLRCYKAERWQDGKRIVEIDTSEGASCLTAPTARPRSVIHSAWRNLQLYLPTGLMGETAIQAELPPLEADRLGAGLTHDPFIASMARMLVPEIERDMPSSRLQLDAFGSMLCVHLLRRAAERAAQSADFRGGLAQWQLRRAMDCVAGKLNENLSLAALADEVGLSQFHFARAFKRSTGLSPHRYLMRCRIERAKHLLTTTDASVAEIATAIGYSEPTQLSRLFQSEIGMSPTVYRRTTAPHNRSEEFGISSPL